MKSGEYRKIVGKIVREEAGKSETTMGDAMQLAKLFFMECVRNPSFLAHGLLNAVKHLATGK